MLNSQPSSVAIERRAPFQPIFSTKTADGKCIDYDINHESLRQDLMQDETYSNNPCPTEQAIGRCSMVFTRGNLQRSVVSYRGIQVSEAEAACQATKLEEVQEISGTVRVTFLHY